MIFENQHSMDKDLGTEKNNRHTVMLIANSARDQRAQDSSPYYKRQKLPRLLCYTCLLSHVTHILSLIFTK